MKRYLLFAFLAVMQVTAWAQSVGQTFQYDIYENDTFYYVYESRKLLYKITDKKNRYVQVGGGYAGES